MRKIKFGLLAIIVIGFVTAVGIYLHRITIPVLEPKGVIAQKELHLIVIAVLLSLIVVVPVFTFAIVIAWRYRETNHTARKKYSPEWDHSRFFETIWWGVPCVIIIVLGRIVWISSHQLDPFKPIASTRPTMTIQVVALDWKWLFIYPGQHVASVNLAELPVGTPVDFEITSDTVMNSFWVPQLGGQIYAMPGMTTHLNLMATEAGSYRGSSANISGSGFAEMTFTAKATSETNFERWAHTLQTEPKSLTASAYRALTAPSTNNAVTYYSSPSANLFNDITLKYMLPAGATPSQMSGMSM